MSTPAFPAWLAPFRTDSRLAAIGFTIWEESAYELVVSEPAFDADDQQEAVEPPVRWQVGVSQELPGYREVRLWVLSSDPSHLYAALQPAPWWLAAPLAPTYEALAAFAASYIAPAQTLPQPVYGAAMFAAIADTRAKTQPDQFLHSGPTYRSLHYFLEVGDYEDLMVELENDMVMNDFVNLVALTQATASKGAHSQYNTGFSASLLSFRRVAVGEEDTGIFFLTIEYLATFEHTSHIQQLKAGCLSNVLAVLPNDVPLDVLGALVQLAPANLMDEAALLTLVREFPEETNLLFWLYHLVPPAEFTRVFLPLAAHPTQQVRDLTARFAADGAAAARVVLMEAYRRGLSPQTMADLASDLA